MAYFLKKIGRPYLKNQKLEFFFFIYARIYARIYCSTNFKNTFLILYDIISSELF